jgi:hypothetical protein
MQQLLPVGCVPTQTDTASTCAAVHVMMIVSHAGLTWRARRWSTTAVAAAPGYTWCSAGAGPSTLLLLAAAGFSSWWRLQRPPGRAGHGAESQQPPGRWCLTALGYLSFCQVVKRGPGGDVLEAGSWRRAENMCWFSGGDVLGGWQLAPR